MVGLNGYQSQNRIIMPVFERCVVYTTKGPQEVNGDKNFYIICHLPKWFKDLISDREEILTGNRSDNAHLTLHNIIMSRGHPEWEKLNKLFRSKRFWDTISEAYKSTFGQTQLKYKQFAYKFLGFLNGNPGFFAKDFDCDADITAFRMAFYQEIEKEFGRFTKREEVFRDGKKYMLYFYQNSSEPLLAVPSHSHGKGVYQPHITVARLSNLILSWNYLKYSDDSEAANALLGPIYEARLRPLGDVDLSQNVVVQATYGTNQILQEMKL